MTAGACCIFQGTDKSCEPLLGNDPGRLPNHVCFDVLARTLERFVTTTVPEASAPGERQGGSGIAPFWPFPLGSHPWSDGAQWVSGIVWDGSDGAWAGIVVERRYGPATVQLVGPVDPTDLEADWWEFSEPCIHISGPVSATTVKALAAETRKLEDWYRRTLLGQSVSNRPLGSGSWSDRAELQAAVTKAVAGVWERGERPTQGVVAHELGLVRESLNRLLKGHDLDWRQLKRRPT